MGSGTRDTMNEIDVRRARLEATLRELEGRMPAVGAAGKKALGIIVGGGAGTTIALAAAKKLFGRKKKVSGVAPHVTVKVLPGSAVLAVVAVAAIWGAVKIVEAGVRARASASGEVRPLRAADRSA